MGTKLPYPAPPGDICNVCDNILWLPGATPMFIQLQFDDIRKCGACDVPAPNGTWFLKQVEGTPCRWEYNDSVYSMYWGKEEDEPVINVRGQGAIVNWLLFRCFGGACATFFENTLIMCFGDVGGTRGTVIVTV